MTPPQRPAFPRRSSRVRFDDADVHITPPETAASPFRDSAAGPPQRPEIRIDTRPATVQPKPVSILKTSDSRRGSDESEKTLVGHRQSDARKPSTSSFASYQHPYDIAPPATAFDADAQGPVLGPALPGARPRAQSLADSARKGSTDFDLDDWEMPSDPPRRAGVLSGLLDLYATKNRRGSMSRVSSEASNGSQGRRRSASEGGGFPFRALSRRSSEYSQESMVDMDPDDPRLTGARMMELDDLDDLEEGVKETMELKYMPYKERRKEAQRIKILLNVTSVLNRRKFVVVLARALISFGAPSHRIESQLVAASQILEIEAEFIQMPSFVLICFGDPETKTSETHFLNCSGRLALGNLQKVHDIYRQVVHDDISAKKGAEILVTLMNSAPIYGTWTRCFFALILSALICPLAFGGSFLDMWIAGAGAFVLCTLQLTVVTKSALYANVFEISMAIFVSFLSRALSAIRAEIFCYTAISSAGIVGILPGYLILTSALELASKKIMTGSVRMVYALIYTLFLGIGLQIGSDLYLLFDNTARLQLKSVSHALQRNIMYSGTFAMDAGSTYGGGIPSTGTFTYTNSTITTQEHIVQGCYRPPWFPWYLQSFPFWTEFLIVPAFSIFSSLANLQPWMTVDLIVMVVISCASYAANKAAHHFIFAESNVVSAIGASVVGLLGNIYSRKFSGTAFTSMVTGVLFLVPSGLSQVGGINASGNGIDIGGAMIAVSIGITVGLFISQTIVYMFGTRKNAAVFSF